MPLLVLFGIVVAAAFIGKNAKAKLAGNKPSGIYHIGGIEHIPSYKPSTPPAPWQTRPPIIVSSGGDGGGSVTVFGGGGGGGSSSTPAPINFGNPSYSVPSTSSSSASGTTGSSPSGGSTVAIQ